MINHKSIKYLEKIILIVSKIFKFLDNKNILRILVYHHIEKKDFKKFYNQLKFLKSKWKFITPTEFENHIYGKKKT